MIHDKQNIVGHWRIIETNVWSREALDIVGPAQFSFKSDGMGTIAFIAVSGGLDYRQILRDGQQAVEFSWEGFDEGDHVCGRSWAYIEGEQLRGHLFIHAGDDCSFVAQRVKAK